MPEKRSLDVSDQENGTDAKKLHVDNGQQEALVTETGIHDAPDEEIDKSGIPVGWRECPRMGKPIFRFIPMKVPLGARFNQFIEPQHQFSVELAIAMAKGNIRDIKFDLPVQDPETGETKMEECPAVCNMVVDLTNSSRYYTAKDFETAGFHYVKIPNRGRGEVPDTEAVNDFVFEVFSHLNRCPEAYILVHCTHGFNRTGFMIASYFMRMLSDPLTKLHHVLNQFTEARSPGIYKNYYIQYLYKYYHEAPPKDLAPPVLPSWKAQGSPDEDDDDSWMHDELFAGAIGRGLKHDDRIGETISKSEADWVRGLLMEYLLDRPGASGLDARFPGSQPVSLERANLKLLSERRYWVTWKADGTRYLLLIHRMGTYLIDRANVVTRVQMRWPMPLPPLVPGQKPLAPVGPFHMGTILDGEMVVDEDPKKPGIGTRRFLAYDMMVINGKSGISQPWGERWGAIKKWVEQPRRFEQEEAAKGKYKLRYDYTAELFRFRRKDFWPLHMSRKLMSKFIKDMRTIQEVDGLILQPFNDGYVPLTCRELLKWKSAEHNSVDFKGTYVKGENRLALELFVPIGRNAGVCEELKGAQFYIPEKEAAEGVTLSNLNGKIVECSWDSERKMWRYMRVRLDKYLPNAKSVYESVWQSIEDNIQEAELLNVFDEAVKGPAYDEDMGRKPAAAEASAPTAGAAPQQ